MTRLRVTLVRHARSVANDASVWQGQHESPLSPEGQVQAKRLADRLAGRSFDLVVASDLGRAQETAAALDRPFDTDPAWREMSLGGWEGKTFEEVSRLHPDLLEALRRGEAISFGGTGETLAEFEQRALAALDRLVERVGEGSVLVVTHGGVIDAVVGRHLGRVPERRSFPIVTNTALTVVEAGGPGSSFPSTRLTTFNDATHLGSVVGYLGRMRDEGVPVAGFVRHGITRANKEGRIQGQSCWGLDEEGRRQASRFAEWYGPVDRVVTSPLRRARETAAAIAETVEEDPDIREMAFGDWEGLALSDLHEAGDELAARIYRDGEDLPRGGTGESFAQLAYRMRGFLDRFLPQPGRRTLVVTHGGAIRALMAVILERGADLVAGVAVSANTGVTHVAFTDDGPMLADYSLAPHLEG